MALLTATNTPCLCVTKLNSLSFLKKAENSSSEASCFTLGANDAGADHHHHNNTHMGTAGATLKWITG